MENAPASRLSRIAYAMRAMVRQLAAAIYVLVALAFLTKWTGGFIWVQPLVALLGGSAMAAIIAGPPWTTHLVGLFVVMLQLAMAYIFKQDLTTGVIIVWVTTALAGALGAQLVTRRRSRKQA